MLLFRTASGSNRVGRESRGLRDSEQMQGIAGLSFSQPVPICSDSRVWFLSCGKGRIEKMCVCVCVASVVLSEVKVRRCSVLSPGCPNNRARY